MDDNVLEFIKMTQGIIERFTVQNFAIKGFGLTYIGIVTLILSEKRSWVLLLIICISVIIFWFLDAFYLMMEKYYRAIENFARTNPQDDDVINYEMNYVRYIRQLKIQKLCIVNMLFTKSIIPMYFAQFALVITVFFV